ncbi:MAG: pilus assembly protein TadG-related protein, partial [Caulobacterales bacterium]|nr:pilus assembly protein TadG-related protein [Caulobacterales bacterium]
MGVCCNFIRTLSRHRSGNVAMVFALSVLPLMTVVGMGVDYARSANAKSFLQAATDAAALAAVSHSYAETSDADRKSVARDVFESNCLWVVCDSIEQVDVAVSAETVEVSVTAHTSTTLLAMIGVDTVELSVSSIAGVAGRAPVEVALALDVSQSMIGDEMDDLRDAAIDFVNEFFGSDTDLTSSGVAIVPYRASVNIGVANEDWLAGSYDPSDYGPTEWKGCVDARYSGHDQTDATPAGAPFTPYLWASGDTTSGGHTNTWPAVTENGYMNEGDGPNLGCLSFPILPLTTNKQDLLDYITVLDATKGSADGGTLHPLGLSWAWRTISANWSGVWKPATNQLQPSTSDATRKILVFMTDG